MARIVISYAHQDRTAVEHLSKDLELMGHDVWVDRNITGGADWWDEVLQHIRECDVFVFAVSADSLASDACKRESYYAHRLHRAFIPVEVTQSVSRQLLPGDLQQLQVVAYLQENKEEFAQISLAIQRAPHHPLPNPLPAKPDVPVSYLMRIQNRLQDPKRLPSGDQDTIVDWLERGAHREGERREAQALLTRMQKRRDIEPVVSTRIAQVLDEIRSPAPPPPPPPAQVRTGTTNAPPRGWKTPMYTFLVLCSILVPLVGFIVGLANLGPKERRGQAFSLIVVGLIGFGLYYALVTSVEPS